MLIQASDNVWQWRTNRASFLYVAEQGRHQQADTFYM